MEDRDIVALYHARSESAIAETARKYGAFCLRIALNLLGVREDADECVNDTYLAAWTRMPPELPASLRAFLGRITRNLSISRYRLLRAQKRYAGMDALLSTVQMPSGIPVATVAIDGAKNAAILAVQIMAVSDEGLAHKLQAARDEGTAAVLKADEELRERYKN